MEHGKNRLGTVLVGGHYCHGIKKPTVRLEFIT